MSTSQPLDTATSVADQTTVLAVEFCRVLASWLTANELLLVRERNAKDADVNICHTQDFCDANMAMHEAFTNATKREFSFESDDDIDLWNNAWQCARSSGFTLHGS